MHDLKHKFASNYVAKGENIISLQKILGHLTIDMTLRYALLACASSNRLEQLRRFSKL
jgi:site-specific recombinase XerD